MNRLGTNKKWFLIMIVVVACIVILVIIQSASTRHGMRSTSHFKLLSKSAGQRKTTNEDGGQDVHQLKSNDFDFDIPSKYSVIDSKISAPKYSKNPSFVDELADILGYKIRSATAEESHVALVCQNEAAIANSCDGKKCLRTKFSTGLKERVDELVTPKQLQISPKIEKALDHMSNKVKGGVEFMILTAASSNHFLESQALLNNVHKNVFPYFKNFTLVFYNIGLTSEERDKLLKFCKCQVVDFPFHEFPQFVRKNKCYSWKPIIIKAHIHQADTVVWVDSSIRFNSNPSYLSSLLQRTKIRSVQLGSSQVISPFRTYRNMYHFFGDEPCVYLNMHQVQATIGLYRNEFFVNRAVLEPWVSCAVAESCMCPVDKPKKTCEESRKMADKWIERNGPIVYGLCHRFDQSAISLILHKLYQGFFHWVTFHVNSYAEIRRNDRLEYFDSLTAGTAS